MLESEFHFFDLATLSFQFSIQAQRASSLGYLPSPPVSVGASWVAFISDIGNEKFVKEQYEMPYSEKVSTAVSNVISNVAFYSDKAAQKITTYLATPENASSILTPSHLRGSVLDRQSNDLDGMVTILNLKTRKILVKFQAHKSPITHLEFSPDGTKLLTIPYHAQHAYLWKLECQNHEIKPKRLFLFLFLFFEV